jgi:hypothetical protein
MGGRGCESTRWVDVAAGAIGYGMPCLYWRNGKNEKNDVALCAKHLAICAA